MVRRRLGQGVEREGAGRVGVGRERVGREGLEGVEFKTLY
jgi:hypothetical protein